jgi:hypothetical protein
MTALARGLLDPPVVPAPGFDINLDFLVTNQAQNSLLRLAEKRMAARALGFILGMTLDDLTWHHQGLDTRRPR